MWTTVEEFLDSFIPDWRSWIVLALVASIAVGALRLLIGVPAGSDER